MKVLDFLKELDGNKGKELLFSYNGTSVVGANYHLTEVKNVQFDTTDCGGKTNHWKETHMQLWENPEEKGKRDYMTVDKIISILERVDGINPLMRETELKFEYGNEKFPTAVMLISEIISYGTKIMVSLGEEKTLCKASDTCCAEETTEFMERNTELKEEKCCEGASCC